MGSQLSTLFIKKPVYDPDNPTSRIENDLTYNEKLICHNEKGTQLKYLAFQGYGIYVGALLSTLTPVHLNLLIRAIPLYVFGLLGIGTDMKRVANDCDKEMSICDQVVKSHRLMVAAGHPPLYPLNQSDVDPWSHLRIPPLILKREIIENWKIIGIKLPEDSTLPNPLNDMNPTDYFK